MFLHSSLPPYALIASSTNNSVRVVTLSIQVIFGLPRVRLCLGIILQWYYFDFRDEFGQLCVVRWLQLRLDFDSISIRLRFDRRSTPTGLQFDLSTTNRWPILYDRTHTYVLSPYVGWYTDSWIRQRDCG